MGVELGAYESVGHERVVKGSERLAVKDVERIVCRRESRGGRVQRTEQRNSCHANVDHLGHHQPLRRYSFVACYEANQIETIISQTNEAESHEDHLPQGICLLCVVVDAVVVVCLGADSDRLRRDCADSGIVAFGEGQSQSYVMPL